MEGNWSRQQVQFWGAPLTIVFRVKLKSGFVYFIRLRKIEANVQ
jgi:hypothetical protein